MQIRHGLSVSQENTTRSESLTQFGIGLEHVIWDKVLALGRQS